MRKFNALTDIPIERLVGWLGIARGKFYDWRSRYGCANEHNAWVPRDHWLDPAEKKSIVDFFDRNPLEGYRRLTFMMLDQGVAAVSPVTTYRVLREAGRLDRWNRKPSKKGTGFVQPLACHEHWHIDISYINVGGSFCFLCSILDGKSRAILSWDLKSEMKESDVEIVLQRSLEKYPGVHPRVISDNGPQFISKDFKTFIRQLEMTHVRTSPYYPQSNGKLERWHGTLKSDGEGLSGLETAEQGRKIIGAIVDRYNLTRLHSAIGYVTPADYLAGRADEIHAARDRKLEEARTARALRRRQERAA